MKRFHPAKPASIYQVKSNVWWNEKVTAFVEAMRRGGIFAMNEPVSQRTKKGDD